MKKMAEIRALTDTDLPIQKKEAREEYFRLLIQKQVGQLENSSRLKRLRKKVARLETLKSERRLGLQLPSSRSEKNK